MTRTDFLVYASIVAADLVLWALLGTWVCVGLTAGGALVAGFAGKWMHAQ